MFREIGEELDPPAPVANGASLGLRSEAESKLRPPIAADGVPQDASGVVVENAGTKYEMAKPTSTKATKTRKSPKPVGGQTKVAGAPFATALDGDHGDVPEGAHPDKPSTGQAPVEKRQAVPIGQRWKWRLPKALW